MSARKPLDEACKGGIWCEVPGHVVETRRGKRWTIGHIKLTRGQTKTLDERRARQRAAAKAQGEAE